MALHVDSAGEKQQLNPWVLYEKHLCKLKGQSCSHWTKLLLQNSQSHCRLTWTPEKPDYFSGNLLWRNLFVLVPC